MTTWILSHITVSHPIFVDIIIIRTIVTVHQREKCWGQSPRGHPGVVNCFHVSQEQAVTCEHWNSIAMLGQECLFVQIDVKYESSSKRTLQPERSSVTLWRGGDRKRYLHWDKEQLISPSGEEVFLDLIKQQLCLRGRETRPFLIKKSTYAAL